MNVPRRAPGAREDEIRRLSAVFALVGVDRDVDDIQPIVERCVEFTSVDQGEEGSRRGRDEMHVGVVCVRSI